MRVNLKLVVMGVSGCGKSTVSQALGKKLGLEVADGDDFHSTESRKKMQAGIALEDADRWPWLDRIANHLANQSINNTGNVTAGKVVACSALKLAYRNQIRATVPHVVFIFLDGSRELIHTRMAQRQGHFMQLSLLDSQLRTLEKPCAQEKDVLTIGIDKSIDSIVTQIVAALEKSPTLENQALEQAAAL